MYRYMPNHHGARVAVLRKHDSVQIGTMPMHVGMRLTGGGMVVRITDRGTPVVRGLYTDNGEAYLHGSASIFHATARLFGFPSVLAASG